MRNRNFVKQKEKSEARFSEICVLEKEAEISKNKEIVKLEKINSLRWLMDAKIIDEERTMPGSDANFKPMFDEIDRGLIRNKIFKIMSEL